MRNVERLFKIMVREKAREMEVATGKPVILSIDGARRSLQTVPLSAGQIQSLFYEIMTPEEIEQLERAGTHDFTHQLENDRRIHITICRQRGCITAVCQLKDTD